MAEHGYAREYDEPLEHDEDSGRSRDERRNAQWRDSREEWRRSDDAWRNEQDRNNEHRAGFMLGSRDWRTSPDGGRHQSRELDDRQLRNGRTGAPSERGESRSSGGIRPATVRSSQDDHYRSWRDRQVEALDRDYADYCLEREQQFHREFDDWRRQRQARSAQPGRPKDEEVMELNNPTDLSTEPVSLPNPTADATLGTNNSENTGPGRAGS